MPPSWLWVVAMAFLCLALVCALVICIDLWRGRRQPMTVMNAVWPITALYFGPVGLLLYWTLGRAPARAQQQKMQMEMAMPKEHGQGQPPKEKPFWQRVFISDSHCGAGCTLGDIIGEWVIFLAGITILGSMLWP